jgi:hypothetical protein
VHNQSRQERFQSDVMERDHGNGKSESQKEKIENGGSKKKLPTTGFASLPQGSRYQEVGGGGSRPAAANKKFDQKMKRASPSPLPLGFIMSPQQGWAWELVLGGGGD